MKTQRWQYTQSTYVAAACKRYERNAPVLRNLRTAKTQILVSQKMHSRVLTTLSHNKDDQQHHCSVIQAGMAPLENCSGQVKFIHLSYPPIRSEQLFQIPTQTCSQSKPGRSKEFSKAYNRLMQNPSLKEHVKFTVSQRDQKNLVTNH